jgi:hypothetical protein
MGRGLLKRDRSVALEERVGDGGDMRGPMTVKGQLTSAADMRDGKRKKLGLVVFASHVSESRAADEVCVAHWTDFAALSGEGREVIDAPEFSVWRVRADEERLLRLDGATLRWGVLVHDLVARRKYLLETIAQISTLGGGWASVGARDKASQFALQQRNVARMLGDETLELLSNVYIGYAHLYAGKRELAGRVIAEQTRLAFQRKEKRQLQIVEAARLQLERHDAAEEERVRNAV